MKPGPNEFIEWDVPNWSQALPFWQPYLDKAWQAGTPVLTIGERYGGLSLWLACQQKANVCTDYVIPDEEARKLHERFGVNHLVSYQMVNIFELPYADNSFDVVVVKSVVGGLKKDYRDKKSRTIENQKLAVEEIRRVLKPGGVYLGAENMRGGWLHRLLRQRTGRNKSWRYMTQADLHFLLDGFSEKNYRFYGYFGSNFKNRMLNACTTVADRILSFLLPSSRLYIGFFAARK